MSRHATPRGVLALLAVKQGRADQLAPELLLFLGFIGWAECRHRQWRLTPRGKDVLAEATRDTELRSAQ